MLTGSMFPHGEETSNMFNDENGDFGVCNMFIFLMMDDMYKKN